MVETTQHPIRYLYENTARAKQNQGGTMPDRLLMYHGLKSLHVASTTIKLTRTQLHGSTRGQFTKQFPSLSIDTQSFAVGFQRPTQNWQSPTLLVTGSLSVSPKSITFTPLKQNRNTERALVSPLFKGEDRRSYTYEFLPPPTSRLLSVLVQGVYLVAVPVVMHEAITVLHTSYCLLGP